MKRIASFVAIAAALGLLPGAVLGQSFGISQFLPLNMEMPTLTPSIKVGYQKFGRSFTVDTRHHNVPGVPFETRSSDARFGDDAFWVGEVGLEAAFQRPLTIYANLRGNAKKDMVFQYFSSPIKAKQVDWNAESPEWWTIDVGAGWRLPSGISILGGLKVDSFSAALSDPFPVAENRREYSSDFTSKVWLPYLGVQFTGPQWVAKIVGSPFGTVNLEEPISFTRVYANGRPRQISFSEYSLTKGGKFLEFSGEYKLNFAARLSASLWGELAIFKFRGSGEQSVDQTGYLNKKNSPIDPGNTGSRTQEADIQYGWSSYAVGALASLSF